MGKSEDLNFENDAVAAGYDKVLVPTLFKPWAKSLIKEIDYWSGSFVLELACGTVVLTKEMVSLIGQSGKIIALDISQEMMSLAKIKCAEWSKNIDFIIGSADCLEVEDKAMDKVVCQQGFNFSQIKLPSQRKFIGC